MKKLLFSGALLLALGSFMYGQEKTEVFVKIVKNGEIITDTSYHFDNPKEAEYAIQMMDLLAPGTDEFAFTSDDAGTMHVEIQKDGETRREKIIFIPGDGQSKNVWSGDGDDEWFTVNGDTIKVIKRKIRGEMHKDIIPADSGCDHHMVWITGEDQGNVKVTVRKEIDGEAGGEIITKEVIVLSDDASGESIERIIHQEGESDEVEVIILKKSGHTEEEDIDVEVIVDKKNKKNKQD